MAGAIGVALVILFMGIYYKLSGMVANFGMILNVLFLMGALAALGATLTLPGIAAIVLLIGMSVDANVLIFERI
ncbi:protein translocase subunit SecD, partial [Klebsiella pneumoniae]|nr:protein translocase subunit SecD [Klebsiella pneumoniae]